MKAAVILTCFNRKEKTRECLENLFGQNLPENLELKVFVCDDKSSDGTSEMIATDFPQVAVKIGTGTLFWGGGMRAAWELASESDDFDFYLWLNDDTVLTHNSIVRLFQEYEQIGQPSILTASCKIPQTEIFSYGGLDDDGPILPNGSLQKVKYINGNLVLIPKEVVATIGFNSLKYTHYLGDYDYGLRAQEAGYDCYMTSTYLAECDVNDIPYWGDSNLNFKKRWQLAHGTKGLALKEYITFKTYHHGRLVGVKTWIDTYLKIIFSNSYILFRTNIKNLFS